MSILKSFRATMALQRYVFNIYCYWRDTVQIISPDYGSEILFV